MHRPIPSDPRPLGAWAVLAVSLICAGSSWAQSPTPGAAANAPRFVENAGQWPADVRFGLVGGGTAAWVTDRGLTLRLERRAGESVEGAVVRLAVTGGAAATVRGEGPRRAPVSFLRGRGSKRRAADAFDTVRLVAVRPGIDLVLRTTGTDGALVYDLELSPGADLGALSLRCDGAEVLPPERDGSLPLRVPLPDGRHTLLRQRAPVAWIAGEHGQREPCQVRFARRAADRLGFVADGWDGTAPLVVDPELTWASYLGGGASDGGLAIVAVPGSGVIVGGWAGSLDFPTTTGAFRATGGRDAFVAKLAADGRTLLWSTYLGGDGIEEIRGIAIAPDGGVVVGGFTTSDDFPVTSGAYQTQFAGGSLILDFGDGFVTKLTPDGSALEWSTYLGRFGDDFVEAVSVATDGQVTVGGETDSDTFPTTPGVAQEHFGSINTFASDAFVTRFTADGRSLVWSTYFGAGGQELLGGMRVDATGRVLIGGLTASTPPPTLPDAYSPLTADPWNGFVAVLSADASRVEASTLCGFNTYDRVEDVCFAADGSLWAVGRAATDGGTTPTPEGAWQRTPGGEEDAFIVRLSPDGTELRAATFLGGTGDDVALTASLGPDGTLLVGGTTASPDLPAIGATAQPAYGGGTSDGFLARIDPEAGEVLALGFLGGLDKDELLAMVPAGGDDVLAVGTTYSSDLPVGANAAQPVFGGTADAFVLRARVPAASPRVEVGGASQSGAVRFSGGESVAGVPFTARNLTAFPLDVTAVHVVVGGSADAARDLGGVSIVLDLDGDGAIDPGEPVVGGPVLVATAGRVVRVPTSGLSIPANGQLALLAVIDSRAACASGAEIVAAVPDAGSVEVRDPVDGRRVLVGAGAALPVRGSTFYCETRRTFSGDLDGNGAADCRDVRWLAERLGVSSTTEIAAADADGNGVIGLRDVDLLFDRVLQRTPIWLPQTELAGGGVLLVSGYELPAGIAASIDGRALSRLVADDRCAVFAVPVELAAGTASVRVDDGEGSELVRDELPVQ